MKLGRSYNRDRYIAEHIEKAGYWQKLKRDCTEFQIGKRICLCVVTSLILCVLTRAWNPPFTFIGGACPNRDIVCLESFSLVSEDETRRDKEFARFNTPHIYVNHPDILSHIKETLINRVSSLMTAASYDAMSVDDQAAWRDFLSEGEDPRKSDSLQVLQKALAEDSDLKSFREAIDKAFLPYYVNGFLDKLHPAKSGNQETIFIYDEGSAPSEMRSVPAREVLIGNMFQIKDSLSWNLYSQEVSQLVFNWIKNNLIKSPTLVENTEATRRAQDEAAMQVMPHIDEYEKGKTLVHSGEKLTPKILNRLTGEYRAILKKLTIREKLVRTGGFFLLVSVATFLISVMIFFSRDANTHSQGSLRDSLIVYILMVFTILIGRFLQDSFFGQYGVLELIPVLVLAQILTIAYCWDVGFIISFVLILVFSLSGTNAIAPFLVLTGACTVTTFMARNVQQRTDLLTIALAGMIVAFCISIGGSFLEYRFILIESIKISALNTCWVLIAVVITEAILPFLEKYCGILTPMRLVEIGNPSHPLLQKLNSEAPRTFNHSMATAMLAENAAKAIGAQVQLVRVGAYFHDVGKLMHPSNFTENQTDGVNPHDILAPRMSKLIITAHVKDGVSMAKQSHLPQQIVDLIEQHHGNFPVGYFLAKANKISLETTGQEVSAEEFRYPCPVPQSKEAGILMLADAVESASRSMLDNPSSIKTTIDKIVQERVEDGQFDKSGLTIGEIRIIKESLQSSIRDLHHKRIKYPGQQGASLNSPPAANNSSLKKEEISKG